MGIRKSDTEGEGTGLRDYKSSQLDATVLSTLFSTVQFVDMWFQTFDLGAGLEKLFHLAYLMKCYFVNFQLSQILRTFRAQLPLDAGVSYGIAKEI